MKGQSEMGQNEEAVTQNGVPKARFKTDGEEKRRRMRTLSALLGGEDDVLHRKLYQMITVNVLSLLRLCPLLLSTSICLMDHRGLDRGICLLLTTPWPCGDSAHSSLPPYA
ncbi:hypothetical protein EYF80_042231 [Liparis tanakae]|uniref:Uncharacterized protein n=1 Tax=Liparis tanakae TaxID=230148 RepID=A0A4Z2G3F2_9TELE|nr:hypothetical protein EYF80_042231 [Liparis tanakae]